jgi:hypothetical protein
MFPTTNNGSNTMLKTQPVSGDSLTQYFRSLSNQMGQTGAGAFNTGASVFGQGVGATGAAGGTANTALDTFMKSLSTLDAPAHYWQDILAGGPAATAAIAPYATMVGQNYSNAGTAAKQGLPMGGYSSSVQAGLPFAQARDVNNSLLQLQPVAAGKLNDIANTQAQVGQGQTGAGTLQANIAKILTDAGLGQEGVGSNLLQSVLNAILQKMGINVTESGQNKALAGSLANTVTGGATSIYRTNQGLG